jgi:threonine/homoserine/homoserine lactone efflux protein
LLELTTWGVFFAAAFVLAIVPGPGMLYVLARTVRGGRREGLLSTLGTALAGLLHTLAAALGISAVLATSALAFSLVKWAGVLYLIYLGLRTLLERGEADNLPLSPVSRGAFRQGVLTEALNPKTALFFLAFIPQFINPNGNAFGQFVLLGFITTLLTSGADLLVVLAAGPLSRVLRQNRRLQQVQRIASGGTLVGLGVYLAVRD